MQLERDAFFLLNLGANTLVPTFWWTLVNRTVRQDPPRARPGKLITDDSSDWLELLIDRNCLVVKIAGASSTGLLVFYLNSYTSFLRKNSLKIVRTSSLQPLSGLNSSLVRFAPSQASWIQRNHIQIYFLFFGFTLQTSHDASSWGSLALQTEDHLFAKSQIRDRCAFAALKEHSNLAGPSLERTSQEISRLNALNVEFSAFSLSCRPSQSDWPSCKWSKTRTLKQILSIRQPLIKTSWPWISPYELQILKFKA